MPMVRITLAVPEDLRFRRKLTMMSLRRKSQSRLTQDEFCARAIAAALDIEEKRERTKDQDSQLAVFLLGICVKEGGLTKVWIPKAKALLESIKFHPTTQASSSRDFRTRRGHGPENRQKLAKQESRATRKWPSFLLFTGWREWNRTTDPYRVKVVL